MSALREDSHIKHQSEKRLRSSIVGTCCSRCMLESTSIARWGTYPKSELHHCLAYSRYE
jgi:hypothetical protein